MKYFVAIEEDLLQELWIRDPQSVVPFSRPFYPSQLDVRQSRPDGKHSDDAVLTLPAVPQASHPLFRFTSEA